MSPQHNINWILEPYLFQAIIKNVYRFQWDTPFTGMNCY